MTWRKRENHHLNNGCLQHPGAEKRVSDWYRYRQIIQVVVSVSGKKKLYQNIPWIYFKFLLLCCLTWQLQCCVKDLVICSSVRLLCYCNPTNPIVVSAQYADTQTHVSHTSSCRARSDSHRQLLYEQRWPQAAFFLPKNPPKKQNCLLTIRPIILHLLCLWKRQSVSYTWVNTPFFILCSKPLHIHSTQYWTMCPVQIVLWTARPSIYLRRNMTQRQPHDQRERLKEGERNTKTRCVSLIWSCLF